MGTNFYIKGDPKEFESKDSPRWHIGKRSAAGIFCFDCGISLGIGGNKYVHDSPPEWLKNRFRDRMTEFGLGAYDSCPLCGKSRSEEDLGSSSAGIELGFNKNQTEKKTGVRSASSFSFAMGLQDLRSRIIEEGLVPQQKCVVDEYGRELTLQEFLDILDTIPPSLRFTELLGSEFS